MKKAKSHAKAFTDHLFSVYNLPHIPVYIHWYHPSVVARNGICGFGVYSYGGDGEKPCIHIAGSKIKKTGVLSAIAHEFVHYAQHINGRNMDDESVENDAEYYAPALMGIYLLNRYENQPIIKLDIAGRRAGDE